MSFDIYPLSFRSLDPSQRSRSLETNSPSCGDCCTAQCNSRQGYLAVAEASGSIGIKPENSSRSRRPFPVGIALAQGDATVARLPRTQKFFTGIFFRRGRVIHRELRGAFPGSPRSRMNSFGLDQLRKFLAGARRLLHFETRSRKSVRADTNG